MKPSFLLFFIIGGLCITILISVFAALIYFKSVQKNDQSNPTKQLTTDVLSVMHSSDEKRKQAQELLSKKNSTEEDQEEAKKLLDQSLADAQKATQLQPNNPSTWYYLSLIYKQLIDVNPKAALYAADALNKAIALNPDNSKLYQDLATIYIMLEQYDDAKETLQKAIQLTPKDANPYFKLGNVYKEMGEKKLAREHYLQAKALTPADSIANRTMIDFELKSLEK